MAVNVYRSTDGSAPVLTGQVGSLAALLQACLVTGYGTQPAAGWSRPFSGTNTAVFRGGSGVQHYLDVNDNAPVSALEARLRGYEAMTAVATGTNPFPTVVQSAIGVIARKSASASAVVRPWTIVADDRTFYLLMAAGDPTGLYKCAAFGEVFSFVGSDSYRSLVVGRNTEGGSSATNEGIDLTQVAGATFAGTYMARNYLGTIGAQVVGKMGDAGKGGSATNLQGSAPFPNPVDGAIWLSPIWVTEPTGVTRGKLRGLFQFLHLPAAINDGDTFSGTGGYAGRTFTSFGTTANGAMLTFDTTGPWDTN